LGRPSKFFSDPNDGEFSTYLKAVKESLSPYFEFSRLLAIKSITLPVACFFLLVISWAVGGALDE